CLADRCPGVTLDREVDVGVRIGFPTFTFQNPAWLTATASVTATRDDIGELAVRVLWVLFQVTDLVQTLLVAQFDAAQVENGILHRNGNLLALAGFLTTHQGGQDTDGEVHTGVRITQGS